MRMDDDEPVGGEDEGRWRLFGAVGLVGRISCSGAETMAIRWGSGVRRGLGVVRRGVEGGV